MSTEPDINQIISTFVEQRYQDFINSAYSGVKAVGNAAKPYFRSTYASYLRHLWERHSHSKSFFVRSEPLYLYDFYIPLAIRLNNKHIATPEVMHLVRKTACSIVSAQAGSGKSIFMKHLLLNSLITKWKVPIFIELRALNQVHSTLPEYLLDHLGSSKLAMDAPMLEKTLNAGQFVLLLDGFDEVQLGRRETLVNDIFALQKKHEKLHIIISSRPDAALEGWPGFSMAKLEPLGLVQAIGLINKLPFEPEIRSKFIEDLESDLFERHKSFASNPLLLSIMLLTYGQSLSIPHKLSVFYNQAYEALFERHDALKGGFRRERRTALDIQEFARLFAAFCLQTYDRRSFEFSRSECLQFIDKAKAITQLNCVNEAFLSDAKESVGLLVDEGLAVTFPHRSFQEYFTARFIADAIPEVQTKLIAKYKDTIRADNLMRLLYEMRSDVVERVLRKPALDELQQRLDIGASVTLENCCSLWRIMFDAIEITEGGGVRFLAADMARWFYIDLMRFCVHNCEHLVKWRPKPSAGDERAIIAEATRKGKNRVIPSSRFSVRNKMVKALMSGGGMFSVESLRYAMEVRVALERKREAVEQSLEKILG